MNIKKIIVGNLSTNCYVLSDSKTNKALIIDPGDDAEFIKSYITKEKLKPIFIVATHGHFDHVLAVLDIKLAYNIPFLLHKKDELILKNVVSSAKYFTGIDSDPPANVDKYLKDGDVLKINNIVFDIIHTPGHTPGSIAIYNRKNGVCFSGDLIFDGGVGRTDFRYSNYSDLRKSIERMKNLPKNTIFYSGHGNELTTKDIEY